MIYISRCQQKFQIPDDWGRYAVDRKIDSEVVSSAFLLLRQLVDDIAQINH